MRAWLSVATERPIVRRALRSVIIVGAILITINHGDAILRGDIDLIRLFRIVLTVIVPYLVSTFSSVAAIREFRDV